MAGSSSVWLLNPVLCEERDCSEFANFTIAERATGLYWVLLLMSPRARSAMNWTCKLLAVALAAVASLSLDLYAQSTPDSQLNKAREELKLFSLEAWELGEACSPRQN
jgi:hypothetical protein